MEEPVVFSNGRGERLFGILHTPENDGAGKKIGVNLLNPGLKSRVAPNRLNVKIARVLCANGFYVLRFDPAGIGDSEGIFLAENAPNLDLWGMIQRGLFVPDTVASNKFFRREARLDSLLLMGHCGGAATALLSTVIDPDIAGLVLADLPMRIVSSRIDMAQFMREVGSKRERLLGSLMKLTHSPGWRDLAPGRAGADSHEIATSAPPNHQMITALKDYIRRGGKVHLIFAENDFALKEYRHVLLPELRDDTDLIAALPCTIIKSANHVYSEVAWQDELQTSSLSFVRNFAETHKQL